MFFKYLQATRKFSKLLSSFLYLNNLVIDMEILLKSIKFDYPSIKYKVTRMFFLYVFFFFIIKRVKARAIPCPHQPPSRGDNIVSVAQGGTATPGATKQLLPPGRVLRESYIYIYIYIPDQLNAETILDVNLHFLSAVCDLKNAFTFSG